MDMGLESKVVVVTGGAKGIGRATVETFARQKATAVIVDKDVVAGKALEEQLNKLGLKSSFIEADLTANNSCEQVIAEAIDRYGRVDVLVNNAGVNDHKGLDASV